jgi:hypothetical protein
VVERCPDKTEVVGPIPTTRTNTFQTIKHNQKTKQLLGFLIVYHTQIQAEKFGRDMSEVKNTIRLHELIHYREKHILFFASTSST